MAWNQPIPFQEPIQIAGPKATQTKQHGPNTVRGMPKAVYKHRLACKKSFMIQNSQLPSIKSPQVGLTEYF